MSGLRSSRDLLETPMVIRMVLAVWKHLQMTNVITLDFSFYRSPRKSILGEALVLGLHLDVVGAGIGPEGPGSPETPSNKHYDHA